MLSALEKFETELEHVQSQVATLTAERDNALQLYQQLSERHEEVFVPSTVESSRQSPELVDEKSFETKDKDLIAEIDTLKSDNQGLRNRVKNLSAEIEKLQSDLQVMMKRQRETGSMANEALTQLEVEIAQVKKALEESLDIRSDLEKQLQGLKKAFDTEVDEKENALRKLETAKIRISSVEIEIDDQKIKNRELASQAYQNQ